MISPECVDQVHVSADIQNIEVEFDSSLHQYLISVPGIPHAGEHVIATFSSSSSSRSSSWSYAIVKEFDELTKDELRTYSKEVDQAKTKELSGWHKLEALKCIPRAHGTNIVDSRWVLRWKPDPTSPNGKTIKARLVVRGFKDSQGDSVDTFASTATRWAQRLVISVAVQNNWQIRCLDVSQAFLQGLDFKTLAKQTGEPLRRVCFTPPSDSWQILSKLGFKLQSSRTYLRIVERSFRSQRCHIMV